MKEKKRIESPQTPLFFFFFSLGGAPLLFRLSFVSDINIFYFTVILAFLLSFSFARLFDSPFFSFLFSPPNSSRRKTKINKIVVKFNWQHLLPLFSPSSVQNTFPFCFSSVLIALFFSSPPCAAFFFFLFRFWIFLLFSLWCVCPRDAALSLFFFIVFVGVGALSLPSACPEFLSAVRSASLTLSLSLHEWGGFWLTSLQ